MMGKWVPQALQYLSLNTKPSPLISISSFTVHSTTSVWLSPAHGVGTDCITTSSPVTTSWILSCWNSAFACLVLTCLRPAPTTRGSTSLRKLRSTLHPARRTSRSTWWPILLTSRSILAKSLPIFDQSQSLQSCFIFWK